MRRAPAILLIDPLQSGSALPESLRACSDCGQSLSPEQPPITVGVFDGSIGSVPGKLTGAPALLCHTCLARFGVQLARVCTALARGDYERLHAELAAEQGGVIHG